MTLSDLQWLFHAAAELLVRFRVQTEKQTHRETERRGKIRNVDNTGEPQNNILSFKRTVMVLF